MDGFILMDKPGGMTSHDVVAVIRRKFQTRQVGHAGTLDPLATGVLILLVGSATKLFNKFSSMDKAYEATLKLGMTTDTADIEGKILTTAPFDHIGRPAIEEAFAKFVGDIEQTPPMVSALKVNGKRLYQLARKGVQIDRQPRKIRIDSLRIADISLPEVKFVLECSKGTYVRKLAEDVGEVLGCGGCISQIRRTRVGKYRIEDAVTLENVNENHIRRFED